MILKVPDKEFSGLPRGAAIWRLLVRILEQPFEVMGLISSRLRGKAKEILFYAFLMFNFPAFFTKIFHKSVLVTDLLGLTRFLTFYVSFFII